MPDDRRHRGSTSGPIRILHVEDEDGFLEMTKLFLKMAGYTNFEITPVRSVEHAFEKLQSENFDIILSDYKMPGMNGLEFLKELRKKENSTPFILFTGKGEEKVAMEAVNCGVNRYITKGGRPKELFETLGQYVNELVEERKRHKDPLISDFRSRLLVQNEKIKDLEVRNKKLNEALAYLYSSSQTRIEPEKLKTIPKAREDDRDASLLNHLDLIILGLLVAPSKDKDEYKSMSELEILKEIYRKFNVTVDPQMLRPHLAELKREGLITEITGKMTITPFHLR